MTQDQILLMCGIGGVLAHTLLKYQSLRTDAIKANINLPFLKYLKQDWVGVLLAVVAVFLWKLTYGEAAAKYTALQDFIRLSFIGVGMAGSYALQLLLSRSKKKIRDIVDLKTDIADEKGF